jgi:uncharacterized protein YndB with AHSA1/START domain
MKEFIVQQQIDIDASKRTVWETLTNPDLTEKYFFGCRVYSNFIIDDPIIFKRMILWLFPFELKGKILEINRGTMLRYSLKNARSSSESIVQIELGEDAGRTLVSVSDDVGQGEGAEQRYNRSVKGWAKILSGLKRVAEKLK